MIACHARLTYLRNKNPRQAELARYDRASELAKFDSLSYKQEWKGQLSINDFPGRIGNLLKRVKRKKVNLNEDSDADIDLACYYENNYDTIAKKEIAEANTQYGGDMKAFGEWFNRRIEELLRSARGLREEIENEFPGSDLLISDDKILPPYIIDGGSISDNGSTTDDYVNGFGRGDEETCDEDNAQRVEVTNLLEPIE
ncbi:MAG: hypothetical protein Q9219_007370 [cf. Caloplaca sp. 3 TL-2023]